MEELLKMLAKEIPVMRIELSQTILGMKIQGGFTKGLDFFCEMNDVKSKDVEELYHKYLKQPVNDFSEALSELVKKGK